MNLKWSKTNQESSDELSLQKAKTLVLCSVNAWKKYRHQYLDDDVDVNEPLLMFQIGNVRIPISSDKLRESFKKLFADAGFSKYNYTPHSLKRVGATFFADKGIPLNDIKRHSLWKSEAIELYLQNRARTNAPVFQCVANL